MTPQLTLTIANDGSLVIERMLNGNRQQITIAEGELEMVCRRILEAQNRRENSLGQDGLPTESQIRCWENHQSAPSYFCPHCHHDGRASRQWRKFANPGSGTIHQIPPGQKGKNLISQKSAEELGL